MNTFIIIYNIEGSKAELGEQIADKIRKHPKWARIAATTWIVKAEATPSDIRDSISPLISDAGNVTVFKINNASWATYAMDKVVTDWMKENV